MRVRVKNKGLIQILNLSVLICALTFSLSSQAQINSTAYEEFNQILLNPYIINPALADTASTLNLRFNHVSEQGMFKGVNRFYIDADTRLGKMKKQRIHNLGVQMTSSRLGEYIRKNRFQLRYSVFLQMSRQSSVSAGLSVGMLTYSFQTTQSGSGGADNAPDGSFGLRYFWKKWSFGVAAQQLFTPVLQPIDKRFELERLYNFDVYRKFMLSPMIDLETQAMVQIAGAEDYAYSLSVLFDYIDRIFVGANEYSLKKTSANLGFKQPISREYDLSFFVTYTFFHSDIPLSDNTLELYFTFSK